MNPIKIFLLFISLLLSISSYAEVITLLSEQEISVEEYGSASSDKHVIWLASERGISDELQKSVLAISKEQNIHILMPDWHDSYLLSPTRSSLEQIPSQDYQDLITYYAKLYKQLFLVAESRAAIIALKTAHQLQSEKIKSIAGIVMIAPYLQKQTPDIGQEIEYQQIASHSNLPLYVFQAERSPRFVPLPLLIKTLEQGGSQVYTHVLKDIRGGYHARDKADLTERDLQALKKLPRQFNNALSMLEVTETAPLKPIDSYEITKTETKPTDLQQVSLQTPKLELSDLSGKSHKLSDFNRKTVIVSFWASWCRPCIEEMPSLVKLKQKYKDNLEILAVNIREDSETIKKFTGAMNINFPLLQDHDSATTDDWKVYVYPSNFVVDKKGQLTYATTGAMDWQDPEIEKLLESLN
jgi:thiol-disulfide isomerase/thioredoxin